MLKVKLKESNKTVVATASANFEIIPGQPTKHTGADVYVHLHTGAFGHTHRNAHTDRHATASHGHSHGHGHTDRHADCR